MCHPKYEGTVEDEESDLETTSFFPNLQEVMELQEEFSVIDEDRRLDDIFSPDPLFDDIPLDSEMIINPEMPDPDPNITVQKIQEFVDFMSYVIDEIGDRTDLERVGQWVNWAFVDQTLLKLPFIPRTEQQEIALSTWFYHLQQKFGTL